MFCVLGFPRPNSRPREANDNDGWPIESDGNEARPSIVIIGVVCCKFRASSRPRCFIQCGIVQLHMSTTVFFFCIDFSVGAPFRVLYTARVFPVWTQLNQIPGERAAGRSSVAKNANATPRTRVNALCLCDAFKPPV